MSQPAFPGYSLAAHAAAGGKSPNVRWFAPELDRKLLRELMVLRDGPAVRDTLVWFALLGASAAGGIAFWGSWWCVPFFFVYGTLYGSSGDSRWHETQHKTAFKTRWMNEALHQLACFMILREPTPWKRSHTRHHTDTLHVGRDPEIAARRPPDFVKIALYVLWLPNVVPVFSRLVGHALGRMDADEKTYVPEKEWPKTYRLARIWLAILAGMVVASLYFHSLLPAMLVGPLPTMYGTWFAWYVGWTQHAGMAEDAVDHRLNTRTIYMNPVFRFLYWNMNYHLEHHIFPMVPYHALPALHDAVKANLPAPYPSSLAAWAEILPAWLRQRRDPAYFIVRDPEPLATLDTPMTDPAGVTATG